MRGLGVAVSLAINAASGLLFVYLQSTWTDPNPDGFRPHIFWLFNALVAASVVAAGVFLAWHVRLVRATREAAICARAHSAVALAVGFWIPGSGRGRVGRLFNALRHGLLQCNGHGRFPSHHAADDVILTGWWAVGVLLLAWSSGLAVFPAVFVGGAWADAILAGLVAVGVVLASVNVLRISWGLAGARVARSAGYAG
ncbi:hypothetical protein ACFOY2_33890 [Nonomuraea purpurea]|uniref:DUF4328 domain-containing protein n=1 Tax=Nonomuraea purpurea TaxID=1849276 RepID=A0ABV8GEP9_9ACTN